jgi:ADP-ribose pyrophosphatase YjhB (NUDIX family)
MSVISHLYRGELGEWCADRLTGWEDLTARITWRTRAREPVRPADGADRQHWAQVERAAGIRLAALVQPAPPYAALIGLVHLGLVRRDWASEQAACYASHATLPAALRGDALYQSPTLDGWARVPTGGAPAMPRFDGRAQDYPAEPMLADLLHRARAYFATNAPPGRLGAERGVARLCWLLAEFQFAYRNDALEQPVFRLFRLGVPTVEELLATVPDTALDEMVAIARQLESTHALAELTKLAGGPPPGRPLGIAGPVFLDHRQDRDLLLAGPDGSALVHVHAAITTNKTASSRQWLWQLLACAWLDARDAYRIRTVGLYFARHGELLTWPVDALAEQLLAGADRDTARADFQALADRLHSESERRRAERDRLRAERQRLAAASAVAVHAVITDVRGLVLTAGEALPGGPVAVGETVEAALRRCVAATTGLEVAAGPLTGVYHDARSGAVTLVFRARVTGGEAGDVRWCARPELPGRLPAVFAEAVHDALDAGRAAVPVREAALPDP